MGRVVKAASEAGDAQFSQARTRGVLGWNLASWPLLAVGSTPDSSWRDEIYFPCDIRAIDKYATIWKVLLVACPSESGRRE